MRTGVRPAGWVLVLGAAGGLGLLLVQIARASGGLPRSTPRRGERRGVTVRGIEQVQFGPGEHQRFAQRALALLAVSRITPVIGQTYPLHRAADAHTALEARTAIGKILLTVNQ